jgi:ABC-type multidrug transport system ATPase subunit
MALDITNLSKRYGRRTVLNGVSASFEPGAVHFVMGDNGAGKSTLLRCIMGLVPHTGSVTWEDLPLRPEARLVTPVFDTAPAYPRLTGHQNIAVLCPEGLQGPAFGLSPEKLRTRVSTYSHGERMRLALTMALNSTSPILLLDEPTNGLDRASMVDLHQVLNELKRNRTVVLTGHNLEFYSGVVDTVSVLRDGSLDRIALPPTTLAKESPLVDIYDARVARAPR